MAQFIEMPDGEYISLELYSKYKSITFFPKEDFLSFEEAREFVRKLKLKNQKEWYKYCKSGKRPNNISAVPDKTYKDKGWKGIGDWLGTGTVASKNKKFISYEKAKKYIIKHKIKSKNDWSIFCKSGNRPNNMPASPSDFYKEWAGWGDFLGTGYIACQNRIFLSFEETKKFVRKLKLKSQKEWYEYCKSKKRPNNIPATPSKTYKDEWRGWGDWLGTGKIMRGKDFISFEEAKKFVRKLKLKNKKEWYEYAISGKKPRNIPSSPNTIYKNKGWDSWGIWLGIRNISNRYTNFISFEEAKKFVKKLKLKNVKEWYKYCVSGKKPYNIPYSPNRTYKDKWISWYDWLGEKRRTT